MPTDPQPSVEATVTVWLERLGGGDERSAEQLWQRYFRRLVKLADSRLPRSGKRAFDEEDVALSAFHSLCNGVRGGRFPELGDRHELWSLLAVITARKARDRLVAERAAKRGAGVPSAPIDVYEVLGTDPTPELAVELAEESERLLDQLEDDQLRTIALLKLEGYENTEIARECDCALRTVERRLALIRQTWQEHAR